MSVPNCSKMKSTVLSWFLLSLYLGGTLAQTNLERKKREILTEILELADSMGRERRDAGNHEQSGLEHTEHVQSGHEQSSHEHVSRDNSEQEQHGKDSGHEQHGKDSQHEHHGKGSHDEHHGKDKREAQIQTCIGSQCNQNNIATGFSSFSFPQPIAQNCFGSACNQNNIGRKKRALIQAFIDEAEKISEEDVEAGEHETENPYENISSIIEEVHKIESTEEDTKAEEDQADDIPTVRKEESSLIRFLLHEIFIIPKIKSPQVHTLNCRGPTGSKCSHGICTVACSDGAKVQLHCPSNSMVVKNTAVGQLINRAEVSCGGRGEERNDVSSALNGFY